MPATKTKRHPTKGGHHSGLGHAVDEAANAQAVREMLHGTVKTQHEALLKAASVSAGGKGRALLAGLSRAGSALVNRALAPAAAAFAAVAAYSKSAQAKEGLGKAATRAGVAALDTLVTLGVASQIAQAVKDRRTLKYDPRQAALKAQAAEGQRIAKAGGRVTPAQALALAQISRTNTGAQHLAATVAKAAGHKGTQAQVKDQPGTGDIKVKAHTARSKSGRVYQVAAHTRTRTRLA